MKKWGVILVLLAGFPGLAQSLVDTNNVKIIWTAPTNDWPPTLWVYKIVPQSFPPVVISNLLTLASFTMAEKTNVEGQPPFKDQSMLYFYDKSAKRELGIYPPLGWIFYNNPKAEASGHQIATNIPDQEEALRLGQEYLQKLGIDRSQLAVRENSATLRSARDEGGSSWFDKAHGTNFAQTYSRGVFFIRRINGIDFDGISRGGLYVRFGNDGKVSHLEVNWKGLEPCELHNTLNQDRMVEAIRNGKSKWRSPAPNPKEIKKITIIGATPFYRGVLEDDQDSKNLEPYAQLTAMVDCGFTNFSANLECPILSTNILIP